MYPDGIWSDTSISRLKLNLSPLIFGPVMDTLARSGPPGPGGPAVIFGRMPGAVGLDLTVVQRGCGGDAMLTSVPRAQQTRHSLHGEPSSRVAAMASHCF